MRPRIDLDAMDVDTPADEILGTVAMAGFSRLPVYEGDLDHVIGFVHIKDLFRQTLSRLGHRTPQAFASCPVCAREYDAGSAA